MNITTAKVSGDPFQIPGTQIKIWTIQDDESNIHKTMSKTIATEGWSGEVEEYINEKGNTYLRQPKKGEYAESGTKSKSYEEGAAFGNATSNSTNLVIAFGKDGRVPDSVIAEVARVRDKLLGTRDEVVSDEQYRNEHIAPEEQVAPPIESQEEGLPF